MQLGHIHLKVSELKRVYIDTRDKLKDPHWKGDSRTLDVEQLLKEII